eukprot:508004-Amphidinium_carterae.1
MHGEPSGPSAKQPGPCARTDINMGHGTSPVYSKHHESKSAINMRCQSRLCYYSVISVVLLQNTQMGATGFKVKAMEAMVGLHRATLGINPHYNQARQEKDAEPHRTAEAVALPNARRARAKHHKMSIGP